MDNDSKHTSNISKQILDQEVAETIDWPLNSPAINPTENLWSILKLEEFLNQECENIELSMKTRCMTIIESNGERIKY